PFGERGSGPGPAGDEDRDPRGARAREGGTDPAHERSALHRNDPQEARAGSEGKERREERKWRPEPPYRRTRRGGPGGERASRPSSLQSLYHLPQRARIEPLPPFLERLAQGRIEVERRGEGQGLVGVAGLERGG